MSGEELHPLPPRAESVTSIRLRLQEQARQRRLTNVHAKIRDLLRRGDFEKAEAYATENKVTTAESRVRAWDGGATLPWPPGQEPKPEPAPIAEPQPPPDPDFPVFKNDDTHLKVSSESINGWPINSDATITAFCPNRRLIIIELDDGREAGMWTQGLRWDLGTKLKVVLDDATADPRYMPGQILR